MLKITLKIEQDPDEQNVPMSRVAGDLITLNEESGTPNKRKFVLQFKKINTKEGIIEFDADDAWDVKENLIAKLKEIETLPWVHKIVEFNKEKK